MIKIIYHFTDTIANKKNTHIHRASRHEFSVAHYTGKVTYDVRDMTDKNRDFVPPEMVKHLKNYYRFKFSSN